MVVIPKCGTQRLEELLLSRDFCFTLVLLFEREILTLLDLYIVDIKWCVYLWKLYLIGMCIYHND